ncbi:YidH family protein [Tolumonas osonensis]|uniref:Putative membrane protein n=1 Tax=Tolumonas osonensis TaxID=675874 RepID=A0A841GMK4_9GAMM|nr:DUF202 domain-containing protein [Tolumonas osonensis]MBB6055702.1 putative membrane protein [Tolumonas osonensis]
MPISESDPRVFFAAERTLLAWLRTGLTIIALGFVVSRFGLFIQLFETQLQSTPAVSHTSLSAFMGILFVLTGSLTIIVAAIQHYRYISLLPQADLPPRYSKSFVVFLSFLLGILGIGLAGYLLLSQP